MAKGGTLRYEIHVEGELDEDWSGWFDALHLTTRPDGTTVISGPIIDQAALHGVLARIRDLGLVLVGVRRIGDDSP